jgi:GNAT superfamily N-acetyltransferase
MAFVNIAVAFAARRRGVGSALLEAARARAKQLGCTTVWGRYADSAGRGFAAAVGAAVGTRQRQAVLTLPPHGEVSCVAGYALCHWQQATPEGLIESYAAARNVINDAPRDACFPPEEWSPGRIREVEAASLQQGRQMRITAALSGQEIVGFTDLRVAYEPGAVGFTDITTVHAAHRRRGLASWLKFESLRSLHAERPDVIHVTTSNDPRNTAMIAVNTRLGFTEAITWTTATVPTFLVH